MKCLTYKNYTNQGIFDEICMTFIQKRNLGMQKQR